MGRRSGPTVAVAVSAPADGRRRASAAGVVPRRSIPRPLLRSGRRHRRRQPSRLRRRPRHPEVRPRRRRARRRPRRHRGRRSRLRPRRHLRPPRRRRHRPRHRCRHRRPRRPGHRPPCRRPRRRARRRRRRWLPRRAPRSRARCRWSYRPGRRAVERIVVEHVPLVDGCGDRSGPRGPPDRWEPGQDAGPATSNDVDGPTVWRRHDGRCHSHPRVDVSDA